MTGQSRRRLAAGEAERGGGLGIAVPATIRAAETTHAKPALTRIQWSTRKAAGAAELAGAELTAAAGVRLCSGARLQRANARTKTLAGHYEVRREC